MGKIAFPYLLGLCAIVVAGVLAWAMIIYGPSQYDAGAAEALAKADAATREAANDLSDDAEAGRMARRLCLGTGGVYDFATGECQR